MQEKDLQRFQNDEHVREAVKSFFFQELDKLALDRVYDKKDTSSIADAKEVIEKAFVELSELYSKDKKMEVPSIR